MAKPSITTHIAVHTVNRATMNYTYVVVVMNAFHTTKPYKTATTLLSVLVAEKTTQYVLVATLGYTTKTQIIARTAIVCSAQIVAVVVAKTQVREIGGVPSVEI